MRINNRSKSLIYVLLCVLLWSLIPVVSKLGQTSLDNHQFLFWSSVISLFTFIVILVLKKKLSHFRFLTPLHWIKGIILGFLGTYLYYIFLYYGYANSRGLEVLIIQYCWPIFVIILSILILRERINPNKVISVVLGLLGVFLVLTKGKLVDIYFDNISVNIMVLLGAFVFALFSVLSKRVEIDPLILVTIYFLTASISSLISMVLLSEFKLPNPGAILPVVINGVLVNGISYIFWINSLKIGKASFIAPFVFLTPIISTAILIIFFKEPFELIYIWGIISVITGGVINRER